MRATGLTVIGIQLNFAAMVLTTKNEGKKHPEIGIGFALGRSAHADNLKGNGANHGYKLIKDRSLHTGNQRGSAAARSTSDTMCRSQTSSQTTGDSSLFLSQPSSALYG